jgi:hypothetical protein
LASSAVNEYDSEEQTDTTLLYDLSMTLVFVGVTISVIAALLFFGSTREASERLGAEE